MRQTDRQTRARASRYLTEFITFIVPIAQKPHQTILAARLHVILRPGSAWTVVRS